MKLWVFENALLFNSCIIVIFSFSTDLVSFLLGESRLSVWIYGILFVLFFGVVDFSRI